MRWCASVTWLIKCMRLDGTEYGDIDYAIFKARTRQAMVLKYPKFYLKGLKMFLQFFCLFNY